MQLQFWNTEYYKSYGEAKAAEALYVCDAPAHSDEVERWGFNGGVLCDAMQAVIAALDCVGLSGSVDAVLVDGENMIRWGTDDE